MSTARESYNFQKIIAITGVLLLVVKFAAWYMTRSVAILTDALESIVNVTSGFIGLYSLYISAKPRDSSHPYGHGKVEFISAAIEGTLITVAGLLIINEAVGNLLNPSVLRKLDFGIALVAITAVVNWFVGSLAVRNGKKNSSLALVASGRHLQTDTMSTIGIIAGLILLALTGMTWLDSVVALIFAIFILVTGYRILRSSLGGIMDEADTELLEKLVILLQQSRRENWIDLHNLRIIKYGSVLHLDCHLTVPWYLNVRESQKEINKLQHLIRQQFGESVELFVHADACLRFSCCICTKHECPVREAPFEQAVEWTVDNISRDCMHKIDESAVQ
ncbi:MAG: cation diffusion facilitator family transporter [Chlorobium sp.]|jgi:cation diffusion facilitator family transporter|uniref:cation diffusion facilitator family transporter n=1 Tax=Chlorobium sp. TaxID=1095 RepID=UPI0025C60856|nr:cation diffusion facilitator family transporter [Chlorobium sp.]MCF8215474.1 cation diffusion facilitator family transporter [Chlorobium sp.]MCF8270301.1 cation diffusion facilitator family transporter [Chlorobium sp.]MCF8286681.1 cation diffusion facilitator family transporter [Chlorobium sp.]MCF8290374.1 cation diffusion facilitator family transporter [Chlorobium sp.]MCF8384257.1 cation diffusion facilitator family transporter [Chlorobium sp.]